MVSLFCLHSFLVFLLLPLVAIFSPRLLNTMVLEKADLGFCSAAERWKKIGNVIVRQKPSVFLDLHLLPSTLLRGGTRDGDSHKSPSFPSQEALIGAEVVGMGRRDGGDSFSRTTILLKSFPLPISKLLNFKTESGVIVFSPGFTMPS